MALALGTLHQGRALIDAQHVIDCINFINQQSGAVTTTADNGTTQALTVAMVTGAGQVFHSSAGGTTPTLTTPTAAAIIAAITSWTIGQSYTLTIDNTNSGTATLAAGTGVTITGTATLATNTTRTFLVTYTAAGAVTFTSVGSGTA